MYAEAPTYEPRIIPTAYGKFLAVSRGGDCPRVAVTGETETEARSQFRAMVEYCLELRQRIEQRNHE
jgi:hypothetical protein